MNTQKIMGDAYKLAMKAKPGIMKLNGKTYTFVFDNNRWVYEVYEDMIAFKTYNTKSLATAKKWVREWFADE